MCDVLSSCINSGRLDDPDAGLKSSRVLVAIEDYEKLMWFQGHLALKSMRT